MIVLRKIWRFVLRMITGSLFDWEETELDNQQAIENLRVELANLRSSVGKILACQCRLERELASDQKKLAGFEQGSAAWKSCKQRVSGLEVQLEAARADSESALGKLQQFRETLRLVEKGARDAQLSRQLAQMRAQVEQISLDRSLDENFAALERLNDDARDAESRAQALKELNVALGQDSANIQKEEPGEQRITGSDSGDG